MNTKPTYHITLYQQTGSLHSIMVDSEPTHQVKLMNSEFTTLVKTVPTWSQITLCFHTN